MRSQNRFVGYVGTYTKGDSKGIYSFTLDAENKKLSDIKLVAELANPTYVALSKNNQFLYSVVKEGEKGGIASYSISDDSGALKLNNKELLPGASPCHVSTNSNNHFVLSANYHKGTVEAYITNDDGSIQPAFSIIEHHGSGPNPERQEKPHTHYAGFTPDEKYAVVIDLGIDALITYKIDDKSLTEVCSLSVNPGSGPRHLEFHPNRKYAYLMTELSSEVIVLEYNVEDGSFKELQYISAIPEGFTENSQGSAIHVTTDGRFVYAANRGHDSIAVFSVHQDTGRLTFVEHVSTEGSWPRDFVLDPTEKFLVVSNEESGNLVLYSRDIESGKLTLLQSDISVPYPVCVKFFHYSM
ncbi:lactonase family protein [Bacillus sp. FJAT-49736]|uniref:lactonase family protein n=1 Tax=Bacillus sp. FJAT-49736 TaxID=2833582 RepID=UPI001BC974F7|nr:lactonase family protein [Bacillus sp. FJAT-49736]MBS4174947.1 lactonase family protein [Bacillus sp. FJAT-49736]